MTIKQQVEKGSKADRPTIHAVLEQAQIAMELSGLTLQEMVWLFQPIEIKPKK